MRPFPPLGCVLLACLLAGCAASGPSGIGQDRAPDSLRTAVAQLRAENRALRDSLRFYDDLDSGQYYRERRSLRDRINRLTYDLRLLRDGGLTVAVLPADSLFATAADSLSAPGGARLRTVAAQLQQTYPDRTVRVEGHADATPLSGDLKARYNSNWGLSAARAATVVRRLVALTPLNRSQFVTVGYGSARPAASNETAAGRRRNRRVRVAVLPLPRPYSRPFETAW